MIKFSNLNVAPNSVFDSLSRSMNKEWKRGMRLRNRNGAEPNMKQSLYKYPERMIHQIAGYLISVVVANYYIIIE